MKVLCSDASAYSPLRSNLDLAMSHFTPTRNSHQPMKTPDRQKVCKALVFLLICLESAAPSVGYSETIKWSCIDEKTNSKGWAWSKGDDWEERRMDDRRQVLLTPKSAIRIERKNTQDGRIYIEHRKYVDSKRNIWDYSNWDAHPILRSKDATIYCYP